MQNKLDGWWENLGWIIFICGSKSMSRMPVKGKKNIKFNFDLKIYKIIL